MHVLHTQRLNPWLESDTLQTESCGKIRGGLAKDRKAASAFPGLTSSVPTTGRVALADGLSWGGVNREKGVDFKSTPERDPCSYLLGR